MLVNTLWRFYYSGIHLIVISQRNPKLQFKYLPELLESVYITCIDFHYWNFFHNKQFMLESYNLKSSCNKADNMKFPKVCMAQKCVLQKNEFSCLHKTVFQIASAMEIAIQNIDK